MAFSVRPAAYLAVYFGALAVLAGVIAALGWTATWEALAVPSMSPVFADMRTLQGALATLAQGGDPRVANPGDPWGRALNYPPAWLGIARALDLGDETSYRLVVGGYLGAFVLACAWLIRRFPSGLLLLACLSGAVLLGIERGNNDLAVFVLVILAIALPHPWARAALIALAAVLKIYPVLLLPLILLGRGPQGPRVRLAASAACLGAVALALVPVRRDVLAGLAATPTDTGGWLSYGIGTLGRDGEVAAAAAILAVAALCLHAPRPRLPAGPLATDALIAGALIWCGSYLLAENYDYRMVFVLPCIPALLAAGGRRGGIALAALVLLGLNQMQLVHLAGWPGYLLNTAAKLALVLVCLGLALRAMLARLERLWPGTASRAAWPGHGLRLPGQRLLERLEDRV